jgi:hypothetical protein
MAVYYIILQCFFFDKRFWGNLIKLILDPCGPTDCYADAG